jgi:hypothetical protein
MKAMTTGFPFPIKTHCSPVVNGSHPKPAHQPCRWSPSSLLWLVGYCEPVINVIFQTLKMTDDSSSNWANIYGVSNIHTLLRCKWTGMEPSAVRNSVTTLCLVRVSTTCHFALLLNWTHGTDWSIDDPGGAGECHYPESKAETLPSTTFPRKK